MGLPLAMRALLDAPVLVVTGHYGVGKTNLSLNLAFDAAARGRQVTVVDLDVVNPFFRSSDYRDLLGERGVRVIAPVFAGTNLDGPSLSGTIAPVVEAAQRSWAAAEEAGAGVNARAAAADGAQEEHAQASAEAAAAGETEVSAGQEAAAFSLDNGDESVNANDRYYAGEEIEQEGGWIEDVAGEEAP